MLALTARDKIENSIAWKFNEKLTWTLDTMNFGMFSFFFNSLTVKIMYVTLKYWILLILYHNFKFY